MHSSCVNSNWCQYAYRTFSHSAPYRSRYACTYNPTAAHDSCGKPDSRLTAHPELFPVEWTALH